MEVRRVASQRSACMAWRRTAARGGAWRRMARQRIAAHGGAWRRIAARRGASLRRRADVGLPVGRGRRFFPRPARPGRFFFSRPVFLPSISPGRVEPRIDNNIDTHDIDTHNIDTHNIDTHSIDTHNMDTPPLPPPPAAAALAAVRRAALSPHNRLASIRADARFVARAAAALARPLVANERCGSWYLPPAAAAASAYFKSTDGHERAWKFSPRRLNLHLVDLVEAHDGCAAAVRRAPRLLTPAASSSSTRRAVASACPTRSRRRCPCGAP